MLKLSIIEPKFILVPELPIFNGQLTIEDMNNSNFSGTMNIYKKNVSITVLSRYESILIFLETGICS